MVLSNCGNEDWDMVGSEEQQTPALTLSVRPKFQTVGVANGMKIGQSCVTVNARELVDENMRAPVDIMVAIDLSSSMHGDKLALCKSSLELLLRQLMPHDRFGLVGFSDEAALEIPLAKLSKVHKKNALAKIKQLEANGCTNISAAVGIVAPVLQMVESPSEVRTVFLLTDGLANMGISRRPELIEHTQKLLHGSLSTSKGCPPITMHCFGYGSNHDSRLLQDMAQCSEGGTYYFVETDSSVMTAIGDALGGVLSVVAQGAMLHLSIPAEAKEGGVDIVQVHHDKKVMNADGSCTVSIGDFYAEESRDVLFDVNLSSRMSTSPLPHVAVLLTYSDTLLKCPSRQGPALCSIARPTGGEVSEADTHLVVQWLRIKTAEHLAAADKQSREGKLDIARATIENAINGIRAEPQVQSDPLVAQLIEDLGTVKLGLASHEDYRQYGGHRVVNALYSHSVQRCVDATPRASGNTYGGSSKTRTVNSFSSTR